MSHTLIQSQSLNGRFCCLLLTCGWVADVTLQVLQLLATSDFRPLHPLLALQLRPQPPPPPPPHLSLRNPQRRLPTRTPPPAPDCHPNHLPPSQRPIPPHLPHRSVAPSKCQTNITISGICVPQISFFFLWGGWFQGRGCLSPSSVLFSWPPWPCAC